MALLFGEFCKKVVDETCDMTRLARTTRPGGHDGGGGDGAEMGAAGSVAGLEVEVRVAAPLAAAEMRDGGGRRPSLRASSYSL